jgi:hypothetical protein
VVRESLDDYAPGTRRSGSGRYEGSGVEMAGMAERYWRELRPSSAARFRLDVSLRHDQGPAERGLRRPRPQVRPKLRTTSPR